MLPEGREIADANGVRVDKLLTWPYRHALRLEGEPVMAPPRASDQGGGGHGAFHILARMAERGRHMCSILTFHTAFKAVTERSSAEVSDVA